MGGVTRFCDHHFDTSCLLLYVWPRYIFMLESIGIFSKIIGSAFESVGENGIENRKLLEMLVLFFFLLV